MFCRALYPYEVTVHIEGRHPYLKSNDLDYTTRQVVLTVPAKDWNHAEKQAINAARTIPEKWEWYVTKIERVSDAKR